MATLSPPQVYALARKHGFSPAGALGMVAVVATESGGVTDRVQPDGQGRGLVQIDLGQHPTITEAQAFDPDFAMEWTYQNSHNGDPSMLTAPLFYGPRDHPDTAAAAQREALAANPEQNKDGLLTQLGNILGAGPAILNPVGNLVEGVIDHGPVGAITSTVDAVKSVAGFVSTVAKVVAWTSHPHNIWRLAEAGLGLVLIFVGLGQLGGLSGTVAAGAQKAASGLLAGA